MNRKNFIKTLGASFFAFFGLKEAIAKQEGVRVWGKKTLVRNNRIATTKPIWADGLHDDSEGWQWWFDSQHTKEIQLTKYNETYIVRKGDYLTVQYNDKLFVLKPEKPQFTEGNLINKHFRHFMYLNGFPVIEDGELTTVEFT